MPMPVARVSQARELGGTPSPPRNGSPLTGIVFNADPPDAIFHVGQRTQAGNEPAVAQEALLDVAAVHIGQKGGLLINLMYALDGLGDGRARAESGAVDVELGGAEVVQAVAFAHLQVPVLEGGVSKGARSVVAWGHGRARDLQHPIPGLDTAC